MIPEIKKPIKYISEETKIKLLYYGIIFTLMNLSVACSMTYHLLAIKYKLAAKFNFLSFSIKGINFPAVNKDLVPLIIFEWIGIIFSLLMIKIYFVMQDKLQALKERQINDDVNNVNSLDKEYVGLLKEELEDKNNKEYLKLWETNKDIKTKLQKNLEKEENKEKEKEKEKLKKAIKEKLKKDTRKKNPTFTDTQIESKISEITDSQIELEIIKQKKKAKIRAILSVFGVIGISCALKIFKSFIREIDFALKFAMENKISWLFIAGIYIGLLVASIIPRIITFVENDLKQQIEKGKTEDNKKLTFKKIVNTCIVLIPVTAIIMIATKLMQKVNFLTSISCNITINNNVINILHNKNNLLAMMLFGMILSILVYDYMDISNKEYFVGMNPLRIFEKMTLKNLSVHISASIVYSVCTLALISVGQSMKNIPKQDFETLFICYIILFICTAAMFVMTIMQMNQRSQDRENYKIHDSVEIKTSQLAIADSVEVKTSHLAIITA